MARKRRPRVTKADSYTPAQKAGLRKQGLNDYTIRHLERQRALRRKRNNS